MSQTSKIPTELDDPRVSISCPHIQSRQKDPSLVTLLFDGAVVPLGEKNLLLCPVCWQVVRAKVYDSIVQEAARTHKRTK